VAVDAQEVVAELRRVVESARARPMSASAVVNRRQLLTLLDQLEAALPDAMAAAEQAGRDRDAVVAEGRQERDRLTADSEVQAAAAREADQLLEAARVEADGLRRDADDYVDAKLATFEVALTKILHAVSRGRERLQGRSDLDSLNPDRAPGEEPADADSLRGPAGDRHFPA
jgi:cell division septum initiation protein DivIVA